MTRPQTTNDKMVAFSDRLGSTTSALDPWFHELIETWRTRNGQRNPWMELTELGRQVLVWTDGRGVDIAKAVLAELEKALADPGVESSDAFTFADAVFDGMIIELTSQPTAERRREREQRLMDLMGDESKLLWIPKLASIE